MSYKDYRSSGFQMLPPAVKNLLIINILFFAATWFYEKKGIDLTAILGLHYFPSSLFYPFQLITYMFMHGSVGHIFFNMLALWMFGSVLENHWGPKRFLIFYLITGIGAALTHYTVVYFEMRATMEPLTDFLANPDIAKLSAIIGADNIPAGDTNQALHDGIEQVSKYREQLLDSVPAVVGASGAIFGILLAFGMLFPNTVLYLLFMPIPIKAKYAVIIYGLIELFSGVIQFSGDNIAHFAHLGGMLFGFIMIKYWQKTDRENFY